MKTLPWLALGALVLSCATTPPAPPPPAPAPPVAAAAAKVISIPDSSLGLSKGSVFKVATPPEVKFNDTAPGELPLVPRPYALAPARIPHGISDFLPITREQNSCVDCHQVKETKAGEPTPIPVSHYTDYRNAPDKPGDQVVGARRVCVSCHLPGSDAKPLVKNGFVP